MPVSQYLSLTVPSTMDQSCMTLFSLPLTSDSCLFSLLLDRSPLFIVDSALIDFATGTQIFLPYQNLQQPGCPTFVLFFPKRFFRKERASELLHKAYYES